MTDVWPVGDPEAGLDRSVLLYRRRDGPYPRRCGETLRPGRRQGLLMGTTRPGTGRRLRPRALLVLLVCALLAGCGPDWGDGRDDPDELVDPIQVQLAGRTFVSQHVEGHRLVPGTEIRLVFTDDVLVASAGCNTMRSGWSEDGSEISWDGDPASTLIGCPPELARQDAWLARLLTDGVTVEDGDADLVLVRDDVRIELAGKDSPA